MKLGKVKVSAKSRRQYKILLLKKVAGDDGRHIVKSKTHTLILINLYGE